MWTAPVPIFEDEDEAELITRFVEMSARFPKYGPIEICRHIFKDLRDPEMRAGQAAMNWSKDIEILDRIDKAKLNGGLEEKPALTKAQLQAKILATTENPNLTPQEKKVMIEGYTSYAANEGWVVKAVEKKTEDKTRRFPVIQHRIYPKDDAEAQAATLQ